jgi:periplasmic protein TonB
LKRFFLAAVLALGLHALLLSNEVEWTNKASLPSTSPVRLYLSYKTPESRETSSPSLIEPPGKANDPSAEERPEEPKRGVVPKQKPPLPKKKTSPSSTVQKTAPEARETAESAVSKSVLEEKPETAREMMPAPSVSPAPSGSEISAAPESLLPFPSSSREPSAAPLRQAVPLYLKNPSPEYPPAARRRGYEGTVIVEVLVDREGRVEDLRVLKSSGHDMLDRTAMRAVKSWTFEPARRGEEKVDMWVKVPLTFRLKD